MPPPSKRVHEAESSSSASAPKLIRGSAANWGRAGFEADPVMNSHCFTWQNASLKEPDEDTERYPWRLPTLVESEPVSTPVSVGPISLWRAAMITKYDLMMVEFDRDGKHWTIMQRSKHYSVSKMVLRDGPQSVKFMLIVADPPNVSTCENIKMSREFLEITAMSYGARAPLELVPCPGWPQHMKSNPTKPPVLPTPRRENKTLIVETDENGTEVDVDRNVGTVQQAGDEPAKEEPAVQLDEALDETQIVVQSPREDRISRAVRLELERLWFEKEAKRRFRRARARSPNRAPH